MMPPNQLLSSLITSLLLLQKVWQKDKLLKMKKVKMQTWTTKMKKEQPALKQKHKRKVAVAADADKVVAPIVVAATVAVDKVADNAAELRKAAVMPAEEDRVVEEDSSPPVPLKGRLRSEILH